MDSFAVVPPTLGYSSMYETECELMSRADVECCKSEHVCLWLTLFFYPQVKNKPCVHWADAFILEFCTVANRYYTPRFQEAIKPLRLIFYLLYNWTPLWEHQKPFFGVIRTITSKADLTLSVFFFRKWRLPTFNVHLKRVSSDIS
jgi:hypothetical protein